GSDQLVACVLRASVGRGGPRAARPTVPGAAAHHGALAAPGVVRVGCGALTPSAVECVGCGVRWPRRGWCESAVVRVGRADCSRDCGCAIPRTRTTHAPAPT